MSDNLFFDVNQLKSCGNNVIIGKTVRIRHPEKVSIGDNVIIDDFTYISGEVSIGDYVHIAPGCVLTASEHKIEMAAFSTIAAGCKLYGGSSTYMESGLNIPTIPKEYQYNVIRGDVTLDAFSIVGANTIILPGCHLPQGIAIGANMVIKNNIELMPWSLLVDKQGTLVKRKGVGTLAEKVNEFYEIEIINDN